jgi:hypothetical protein
MDGERLAAEIEAYLAEAPQAVVVERGEAVFDLSEARYSVTTRHGKCLLHVWSAERNMVRRVLEAERKNGVLRLAVQRFGAARGHTLEICAEKDRRSPAARRGARATYLQALTRVLKRLFPQHSTGRLSTAMDLERSFSPVYTRGLLRRGRSATAVLGVNGEEPQAMVDAALTFGLVWLDHCRRQESGQSAVEGLALFAPRGRSAVLRARLAQLDHAAARFQVFELDEDGSAEEVDPRDGGNIETRLMACAPEAETLRRFGEAVAQVRRAAPECEVAVRSATEIAFRLRGLEIARARLRAAPGGFARGITVSFGAGRQETELSEENEGAFAALARRVAESRRAEGDRRDPLWRMSPERWLESLVVRDVSVLEEHLQRGAVYSQVPAFAASDRAMIDVLCATQGGRLAVIELKADEDIHLPLQGLDYWARVQWHHQRGEFTARGYFPGRRLSDESPLLYLVAPALHVHPATDTLLRYFSPKIEWTLLGVGEGWRKEVKVVFRKRRRPPGS